VGATRCKRGLHDLDDPANLGIQKSNGSTFCKPCRLAYQRARREGKTVPPLKQADGATTVITLLAATAEDCLARFLAFAGDAAVTDLGTLDGYRRYRVPAHDWSAYTREISTRPQPGLGRVKCYRCAECDVTAISGALSTHQKASGHEGKVEV
jgi:hypothetical protein